MGFRSTLISEDYGYDLPDWFKEKYKGKLVFCKQSTLIASAFEFKIYGNDLFEDYQKALTETGIFNSGYIDMRVAVLHEDGVISKVVINKDGILYIIMAEEMENDRVWQQGY